MFHNIAARNEGAKTADRHTWLIHINACKI